MAHYVKKMMGKTKRFTKRNFKKTFTPYQGNSQSSGFGTDVICYECNRKGHIRPNCPNLKKENESKDKRKKDKIKRKEVMVAQAKWDNSSSESSSDDEEACHITRHMALMARRGESDTSSNNESSSSSEDESSSSEDEVLDSHKQKLLFRTMNYLKHALEKSKSKVKALKEELRKTRTIACDHSDLNEENIKLKEENEKLKTCLEKFTLGSQKLDLILNSQRAVYNKAGLGYRPKEVSYISLVGRQSNKSCTKGKLAWVPKKYLSDVSESSFWIPKKDVFRIM